MGVMRETSIDLNRRPRPIPRWCTFPPARDLQWQKSFVVRARRHERDSVPVHNDGRNSRFFYNLARLRRWFGIRFNFETIYLVDEMFKQRGRTSMRIINSTERMMVLPFGRIRW